MHAREEKPTWILPGGPGVTNPPCKAGNGSSIPGQGTRIPGALRQPCLHTATPEPKLHNGRGCVRQWKILQDAAKTRSGQTHICLKRDTRVLTRAPQVCTNSYTCMRTPTSTRMTVRAHVCATHRVIHAHAHICTLTRHLSACGLNLELHFSPVLEGRPPGGPREDGGRGEGRGHAGELKAPKSTADCMSEHCSRTAKDCPSSPVQPLRAGRILRLEAPPHPTFHCDSLDR